LEQSVEELIWQRKSVGRFLSEARNVHLCYHVLSGPPRYQTISQSDPETDRFLHSLFPSYWIALNLVFTSSGRLYGRLSGRVSGRLSGRVSGLVLRTKRYVVSPCHCLLPLPVPFPLVSVPFTQRCPFHSCLCIICSLPSGVSTCLSNCWTDSKFVRQIDCLLVGFVPGAQLCSVVINIPIFALIKRSRHNVCVTHRTETAKQQSAAA
jgi:hypothetical protein